MASTLMIHDAAKELRGFLDLVLPSSVKNYLGRGAIGDINKASGKMSLELFGVYSDNIPDETAMIVKKALESKYAAIVAELISELANEAAVNRVNPIELVGAKLGNRNYNLRSSIADRSSTNFGESAAAAITFNENSLGGKEKSLLEAKGDTSMSDHSGTHFNQPIQVIGKEHGHLHRSNGDVAVDDHGRIPRNKDGSASTVEDIQTLALSFTVKVSLLALEASKLIETIGTARDRSMLFNYMKLRASVSSLWKGFILNLREIDKAVKRDVSNDVSDRILSDMMRMGGFLVPEKFSEIGEAKYYIMILEQSDIDALRSQHNFDIRKPSSLHLIFSRYNILSLVTVDTSKKTMLMYDSDNPLRGSMYNYGKDGSDAMASIFAAMARK